MTTNLCSSFHPDEIQPGTDMSKNHHCLYMWHLQGNHLRIACIHCNLPNEERKFILKIQAPLVLRILTTHTYCARNSCRNVRPRKIIARIKEDI